MKVVCVLLLCLAAVAFAYFGDFEEDQIMRRSNTKKLPGGYTFVTTEIGNSGKFKCDCYRGGKKVWAGMCGVKDKSFSYRDCY